MVGKLTRVAIDCNRPGALVTIDGENRSTITPGKPIIVEPGMHQLTLVWESELKATSFDAIAGHYH